VSRYDLDRPGLAAVVERVAPGAPRYRVDQVWEGLYRRFVGPEELTSLPAPLRHALGTELGAALTSDGEWEADGGATRKWVWRLADGARIETVLMHAAGRSTVCVSTQAGCAMACGFCATGQAGFTRHLSVGEIVEQVARAGRDVTHVVFMGMGEPLANYDATWGAVRRLHDDVGLSARRLTVSTVGIVPGIRRLASEDLPVNLAVSLHAADDALRDELVPINRRYPLAALAAACRDYVAATRRRLSLEWALMAGVNDRPHDAAGLAGFARPLGAHVNLIPLNPTPGFGVPGSPPAAVRAFQDALRGFGVNVTVRRPRGRDIAAACGQLAGRAPDAANAGPPSPTCHT
jgi:23S rRNA (adenine2503-C2)-methyltransferase